MPDSITTTYDLVKPELGGSDDTWGQKLNANMDKIAAALTALQDQVDAVVGVNNSQQTTLNSHTTTLNNHDNELTALAQQITNTVRNQLLPVGTIITTDKSGNPSTWLGFGIWERVNEGRALVGYGTTDGVAWGAGTQRGAATHRLSESELPQHKHSANPPSAALSISNGGNDFWFDIRRTHGGADPITSSGWALNHGNNGIVVNDFGEYGQDSRAAQRISYNAAHNHTGSVNLPLFDTYHTGSNGYHNNLQPSESHFMWKRTA